MTTQIAILKPLNKEQAGLGFCFIIILAWFFLEYGRPPFPLKLPLIISLLLFFNWVTVPEKKWPPQIVCFILLIGEMLLLVPLADNNYSALWRGYQLTLTLLFICVPLVHFVDSMRKVNILIATFLVVFAYIALFALFTDGMGPGRNQAGQDENYTAAMMCMAIPVAAFCFYFMRGFKKILLAGALVMYVGAVIVGFSRGGFIGLMVAVAYCLFMSPKKIVAWSLGILGATAVLLLASGAYWDEVRSITAIHEGTADLRLEAWKIGIRMFLHNPILGVGPDNFKWHMVALQSPEQWEAFDRGLFLLSHSSFIDLLTELGTVGVSVFLAVLYYNYQDIKFMTKELQKWKERLSDEKRGTAEERELFLADCERIRYYAYGLLGGTLALLVAFAFVSGFYYSDFWVMTAMIVALRQVANARLEQFKKLPIQPQRPEAARRFASMKTAQEIYA
jgi:O-antigen ligase